MKSIRLYIEKAGIQTTFQDLGRLGLRAYGIPTCGAMDKTSFQLANQLVGNPNNTPLLEMTLKGDTIHFFNHTIFAITGADMLPKLNGKNCPMYQTMYAYAGDILKFGFAKNGCRTYLAIQGRPKIDVEFNSYATYIYGRFGGFKGRALKDDDVVSFETDMLKPISHKIAIKGLPFFSKKFSKKEIIRVILAPEYHWFEKEMLALFFKQSFIITANSNRMGIQLKSQPIIISSNKKMLSSPTAIGTIQVLPTGQLIILMQDGQTTGGYPRIANVITADLDKLAQIPIHNEICFDNVFTVKCL